MPGSTKQRVLITGGAGFIGCALGRWLCDATEPGYDVYAMDNLLGQVHPEPGRPADLDPRVTLLPLDVSDARAWDVAVKLVRPEVIVHLAAETGTGQSLTQASRHGLANVVGTTQLLDAVGRHDIRLAHLVLSSSRAVYGEGAWRAPGGTGLTLPPIRSHEALARGRWEPWNDGAVPLVPVPHDAAQVPSRPANIYAATKLAQEHVCTAWAAATGTPLSILRLQNVYGPGQSITNSYTGIVTLFARVASQRGQIEIYEDGRIIRDFVYIDDVVRAFASAIAAVPAPTRMVDIGSGIPLTVHELGRVVAGMYDAPEPVVTGAFRDGDVRAAYADIGAADGELGWRPEYPLAAGLERLIARLPGRVER